MITITFTEALEKTEAFLLWPEFLVAIFVIAVLSWWVANFWRKKNGSLVVFQPSHDYAVSIDEAAGQLRALLSKASERDRSLILGILIRKVTPKPHDPDHEDNTKHISHEGFRVIFRFVDVELEDSDFDFLNTLNMSRSRVTAVSAMQTLQVEYPWQ